MSRISALATQVRVVNKTDVEDIDDPALGANGSRKIYPADKFGQFGNTKAAGGAARMLGLDYTYMARDTGQTFSANDPFAISGHISCPKTATTRVSTYFGFSSVAGDSVRAGALRCYEDNDGALYVDFYGATTSDRRRARYANYVTDFGATRPWLYFDLRTGTIYLNGLAITSVETTAGTPPAWTDAITGSILTIGASASNQVLVGAIANVGLWNHQLSAAEVAETYFNGGVPPDRFQWASQTPTYTSDFTAGTNGWQDYTGSGTPTGNIDQDADGAGIPPSNDWLRFKRTSGGNSTHAAERPTTFGADAAKIGKVFRVRASLFVPTGSSITYITMSQSGSTYSAGNLAAASPVSVAMVPGSTVAAQQVINVAGGTNRTSEIFLSCVAANGTTNAVVTSLDSVYAKGITATQVGCVGFWPMNEGAGLQFSDLSPLGLDLLATATGMEHVLPDRVAIIRPPALVFGGSGNLQVWGASCIDTSKKWRIRSVSVTSTAGVNVSLGSASGGTQYVNAQAVVNGDTDIGTFASRVISGANLWINASGAATISPCIILDRVN